MTPVRFSMGGRVALVCAAALLAVACSSGDPLPGVGYRVPGESTSAKLLPLTVPPDFGLRPEPVDETPEGYAIVSAQEEEAVLEEREMMSQGEEIILARSDAIDVNPDIRRLLDQDNAVFVGNPVFVDELMFGTYPTGGVVLMEEGGDVAEDVVIREGSGDDESDFQFFSDWF
jgi:hypothetical protein